jgi:hypothetical protein
MDGLLPLGGKRSRAHSAIWVGAFDKINENNNIQQSAEYEYTCIDAITFI